MHRIFQCRFFVKNSKVSKENIKKIAHLMSYYKVNLSRNYCFYIIVRLKFNQSSDSMVKGLTPSPQGEG